MSCVVCKEGRLNEKDRVEKGEKQNHMFCSDKTMHNNIFHRKLSKMFLNVENLTFNVIKWGFIKCE